MDGAGIGDGAGIEDGGGFTRLNGNEGSRES